MKGDWRMNREVRLTPEEQKQIEALPEDQRHSYMYRRQEGDSHQQALLTAQRINCSWF